MTYSGDTELLQIPSEVVVHISHARSPHHNNATTNTPTFRPKFVADWRIAVLGRLIDPQTPTTCIYRNYLSKSCAYTLGTLFRIDSLGVGRRTRL